MASVVYLPHERRQTTEGDVGQALGMYLATSMEQRARQEKRTQVQGFIDAVNAAPDRERALEVVANYAPHFTDPKDLTQAFKIVDEFKPAHMDTPAPVTMYTPEGEPTTVSMTPRQLQRESDPNLNATRFPGMSLTKPGDLQNFYQPGQEPGDIRFVGRMPGSKRPEGALTLPELSEQSKARTEARAERTLKETEKRTGLMERARNLAEERFAASLERQNAMIGRLTENQTDQEIARGQAVVRNAQKTLAVMMNARLLPDGTFGFDDENKAEQFRKQVDYITAEVERNPKILKDPTGEAKLASAARKAIIGIEKPPAPAPAPKEKGAISSAVDKLMGKSEGRKTEDRKAASTFKAPNGKSYSAADVDAAAKKLNMSVQDFVRTRGLRSE